MGRRKERRIAAIASGRRVKLDLFAEPSGDLGSSSTQDEVGGADDAQNRAGLPSLPSPSGKQPENPLVLLGQYSDDELDDGISGDQDQTIPEDPLVVSNDSQDKVVTTPESKDSVNEERNGAAIEKAEQMAKEDVPLDATGKLETGGSAGTPATDVNVPDENCLTGKTPAASISDIQVGDVISGWKIVWHEESNQYYYWNIATGETSWAVPDILLEAGGSVAANNGEKEKADDTSNTTFPNFEMTEGSDHKVMTEPLAGDVLDDQRMDDDADQNNQEIHSSSAIVENFVTSLERDFLIGKPGDKNVKSFDSCNLGNEDSNEAGSFPSALIKRCELLLEQVNSVKGSKDHLHGHAQMNMYIFEVQMRLADLKSLECHGCSLLPFWQLSEKRLQQLEINITDVLQELKAEKVDEVGSTDSFAENSSHGVDANSSEKKAVLASDDISTPEPDQDLQNNLQTYNNQTTADETVTSERYFTGYSGNASGASEEDMDVDMEVDDTAPSSSLDVSVPSEQLSLPSLTPIAPGIPTLGEVYSVPPPPDEDWIPPPPPDDEPFPPPPPDEPPETSYSQPSDLVPIPSFPYVDHYNLYPGSHFQYVAQPNSGMVTGNVYGQIEECQPAVSQPPLYFELLADTYSTATVTPADTGLYYGLQSAISQPLVQTPILDSLGSLNTHGDPGSTLLPKADGNSLKATLEAASSQAQLQSSSTNPVTESVSASSIPASTATVSTSATASKAQPKVPRSKKRTVAVVSSLRSNKKVSSLVDKWKAAKEELQEQENEPENALEILERKRQREIEEWHKQQIASGEANDNANFQPLGGDWRERVKRKRAQLAKESVQNPSNGISEVNSQADLDELSRGLPHGWQAFWDDASKQIYYGNTSTSETSWIRPTD